MTNELLDQALVEEATKKSGLVWVRPEGAAAARALWHVWHEGAACLVGDGPGEQPLSGLADGGRAEVTVRSKDKGGRLVSWTARVVQLAPGGEAWDAAVAELKEAAQRSRRRGDDRALGPGVPRPAPGADGHHAAAARGQPGRSSGAHPGHDPPAGPGGAATAAGAPQEADVAPPLPAGRAARGPRAGQEVGSWWP